MTLFHRDTADGEVDLYYEVHGSGFPVLLIAPGGMRSAVSFWEGTPWNPITAWQADFQVIAMDQRNAGQSSGPVRADHGWQTYTDDQLALLDHLGVNRFAVAGMCIGGPYCMGLIDSAPQRVSAAVLFQSIGFDDNRDAFYAMFDSWAEELAAESHADVPAAAWRSFRSNLFDADFMFNVDEAFVRACTTPLEVLCGNDLYHPAVTSRRIAELAPNAEFIEHWKEGEPLVQAQAQVLAFLQSHRD